LLAFDLADHSAQIGPEFAGARPRPFHLADNRVPCGSTHRGYLEGLLSEVERKSIDHIAARVGVRTSIFLVFVSAVKINQ
jgi:hypothetical protein